MNTTSLLQRIVRRSLVTASAAAMVLVFSALPVTNDNAARAQDEKPEELTCEHPFDRDRDGDGVASVRCGGADCDDNDANRYPGNTEICNAGRDEDCDPQTGGQLDSDGDGHNDWTCH